MDEPAPAPAGPTRRTIPLYRDLSLALFAGLVVLAVAFYLWWGLEYGTWLDNGVYAVTIVLLLFGLAGMWLVAPSPAPAPAPGTPSRESPP